MKQDGGAYSGMYPVHVVGCEGEQILNPISITKEQTGQAWHFLDMEILQRKPGVSQICMYDGRHYMPSLAEYRRYPLIETRLWKKCLYATLHCQLCWFVGSCSEDKCLRIAATKRMKDMIQNMYVKELLKGNLSPIMASI